MLLRMLMARWIPSPSYLSSRAMELASQIVRSFIVFRQCLNVKARKEISRTRTDWNADMHPHWVSS